ncbi:MAG: gas vesicle protein [Candidatus Scalindua rubra]|uniref:Gas vesicle protein n=1 Tax=Candidatus Scalindua rubra TaxID=1872076 RepID=A0A1E3XF90_9BACT|nr:MAG: gas vesicle protein [Candidatus Scalindua rubra]
MPLAADEMTTVLEPRALPNFVETPQVRNIANRALAYIAGGFPVHFRGISGSGKTTLAMHVASKIGRPVIIIHGDEEFSTSDLVGGEYGYRLKKTVDNFIHSVLKTEEDMQRRWVDNRLTVACKYGFTLIYDEFTRSRPEANNTLLSVLQEKMLDLPAARQGGEGYLRVDPNFTAIFSSNPEEYAGVYRSQDALRDRMITIDLDYYDEETEIAICEAKTGLSHDQAAKIVRLVRALRESGKCEYEPTIRGGIMIGKTLKIRGGTVSPEDENFRETATDILTSETSRIGSRKHQKATKELIKELIVKSC